MCCFDIELGSRKALYVLVQHLVGVEHQKCGVEFILGYEVAMLEALIVHVLFYSHRRIA